MVPHGGGGGGGAAQVAGDSSRDRLRASRSADASRGGMREEEGIKWFTDGGSPGGDGRAAVDGVGLVRAGQEAEVARGMSEGK